MLLSIVGFIIKGNMSYAAAFFMLMLNCITEAADLVFSLISLFFSISGRGIKSQIILFPFFNYYFFNVNTMSSLFNTK